MASYEHLFPRGIAQGEAFCNREEERKQLMRNIKAGRHTLLISPRRYGKTSLVRYVIEEMKLPFGEADLFVAVDAKRIEQRILAGIKMTMSSINTSLEQTLRSVREYFKKLNSQWVIGTQGVSLALIPAADSDPATNILEALQMLENFLAQKKKRAVIFLDEAQEIGEVAEGKGIEGAIRHVAQQSKYLSFVFSGSSRHLLSQMFFDKARPLYKLCDRIVLDRISIINYEKHINLLAQKRWRSHLTKPAMAAILHLTECHPYYINNLCFRLWDTLNSLPSANQVELNWDTFIKEERLETVKELGSLSLGQRKILIAIASGQHKELTNKKSIKMFNMNSSSIVEALKVLEQKDYVEYQNDGYVIIDPLIKTSLQVYFNEKENTENS